MKNLKVRQRIVSLAATTLTLISPFTNKSPSFKTDFEINTCYVINSTIAPFAYCTIGEVYIIPKECFKETIDNINKDSIIIIDERTSKDPNMQIYNSANITDENHMYEILKILEKYNELYPSGWNRTTASMLNEWEVHNICSSLNYKSIHTDHVDLNNEDEDNYNGKLLTKILNN